MSKSSKMPLRPARAPQIRARPSRAEAEAAIRTLLRLGRRRSGTRGTASILRRAWRAPSRTGFPATTVDPEEYLARTFEEVEGYDDMIVLRDIRFESHCEHHLAPIIGRAHVGYLPTNKVVGISKLARVVEAYARRLQVQEKMNAQIAHCIQKVLEPKGRGGGDRGGASMHDHARRAQAGRHHGDFDHAGRFPQESADAPGVSERDRKPFLDARSLKPQRRLKSQLAPGRRVEKRELSSPILPASRRSPGASCCAHRRARRCDLCSQACRRNLRSARWARLRDAA